MCILLLEDIDLIFDQDEGFLSSLSQLIVTSKRPIILTTTDKTPSHVQKFINQYECTIFQPLSMHCLAVWLQIVCLVEGLLVDRDHLGNLLEYNKGDIRRTLLQVQFWCQSGGQIEPKRELPVLVDVSEVLQCTDEDLQVQSVQITWDSFWKSFFAVGRIKWRRNKRLTSNNPQEPYGQF